MTTIDDLIEDVEKVIASYCNEPDAINLRKVSKRWQYAVEHCKLYYEGPCNGDTVSQYTIERNGIVKMPFVQKIKVQENAPSTYEDQLLLCGPQIPLIRKRWRPHLEIDCNPPKQIYKYCNQLKFSSIYIQNNAFTGTFEGHSFATDELISNSRDYVNNTFPGLKTLRLFNTFSIISEDWLAIEKAMKTPTLKTLEITGLLNDFILQNVSNVSRTLSTVFLNYQGLCTFKSVKNFQRCLPNVVSFALRSSNLQSHHLNYFDWDLWPKLEELDLENNLTLRGLITIPQTLKKLFLAFTKAYISNIPESIEDFSTNLYYNDLYDLEHIPKLRIHFLEFWNDKYIPLFSNLKAKSMRILFKDFFYEHCIDKVKTCLPNCDIKKLNFLEM